MECLRKCGTEVLCVCADAGQGEEPLASPGYRVFICKMTAATEKGHEDKECNGL